MALINILELSLTTMIHQIYHCDFETSTKASILLKRWIYVHLSTIALIGFMKDGSTKVYTHMPTDELQLTKMFINYS